MKKVIPLCVSYWDRVKVLDCGANYSEDLGYYLTEEHDLTLFVGWLPRMYDPTWEGPVILPDMLPNSTWEQNIRHLYGTPLWDRLRKHAYSSVGYRCTICGAQGKLEAHEAWELENETQTQRLVGILALCPLCHKVHHLGIARRLGMLPQVKLHMQTLNGWTAREVDAAISEAYEVWEQRCEWPWTVDLSYLHDSTYIHVNKNGLGIDLEIE